MFRRALSLSVLFLLWSSPSFAGVVVESFRIFPPSLYVDDDAKVMFTAQLKAEGTEPPREITLIEEDTAGEKAKYRWPMLDDGTQGDFKAGDGIYSRTVQIKESKAKTMKFMVIAESSQGGPVQKELPIVGPDQVVSLEVKNRPSMIEILGEIWAKIKKGRAKAESGGS